MINDWKQHKISNFLLRKKDQIFIDDRKTYKRLTIKMHNKGICVRDEIVGSRIGTKNQFTVKSGWLLLSKIDARNGAFGIIPSEADGGIITGNFWAYELDLAKIDPQFFFYFSHSQKFLDFCIASSQGATNRRYLQEELFLNREILLPPLSEQRRIVKKIKEIEEKVKNIKILSGKNKEHIELISQNTIDEVFSDIKATKKWPQVFDTEGGTQPPKGTFIYSPKTGYIQLLQIRDFGMKGLPTYIPDNVRLKKCAKGDILIGRYGASLGKILTGKEGAYNVAIAKIVDINNIFNRDFLLYYLQSNSFQKVFFNKTRSAQAGFNKNDLKEIDVPFVSKGEQKIITGKIDGIKNIFDKVSTEFGIRRKEIDSLMPSILAKAFNGEL